MWTQPEHANWPYCRAKWVSALPLPLVRRLQTNFIGALFQWNSSNELNAYNRFKWRVWMNVWVLWNIKLIKKALKLNALRNKIPRTNCRLLKAQFMVIFLICWINSLQWDLIIHTHSWMDLHIYICANGIIANERADRSSGESVLFMSEL
jgi:hypothetical protein